MLVQLPATQAAIVGLNDGSIGLQQEVTVPQLTDDMILVRTVAVALNPMDAKFADEMVAAGAIAGMAFAGEVVAVGSSICTAAQIKVGDRVCGAVPGMHALSPDVGAFAEYVGASDITTLKIPSHISFEAAASLASSMATICMALFQSLNVPGTPKQPAEEPVSVLVYGGSTTIGTLAIQLLKL